MKQGNLRRHPGTECKVATKETNLPTALDVVNRGSGYVASTHRAQADDACTGRPKSLIRGHNDTSCHRACKMTNEPAGSLLRFLARLGGGSVEGLER